MLSLVKFCSYRWPPREENSSWTGKLGTSSMWELAKKGVRNWKEQGKISMTNCSQYIFCWEMALVAIKCFMYSPIPYLWKKTTYTLMNFFFLFQGSYSFGLPYLWSNHDISFALLAGCRKKLCFCLCLGLYTDFLAVGCKFTSPFTH